MEEEYKEIKLESITFVNDKPKVFPSLIKLYDTHAEFELEFKFTTKYKVTTGDDILDKINPTYETSNDRIKETVYMDKFGILGLSASEEEDYSVIEISGVTDKMILTVKTFNEAVDFIKLMKNWRYGKK